MDADNLHRRLKKIVGQVQAIDRMVEEQNSARIVENNGTINHIENNQGPVNGDVKEQRFLMGNGMSGKQIEAKC
mgnify:CR=1 FL=1